MFIKLWKAEQMETLPNHLPEAVRTAIEADMDILNRYYGENRDPDRDLGGYIAFFPETDHRDGYDVLLNRYHLKEQEAEYREVLVRGGVGVTWVKELFMCGSDYGLVIIRPLRQGSRKQLKNREANSMFEEGKDRYVTRGVADVVPLEVQIFLWEILREEKSRHHMDYLQVFKLSVSGETLHVDYHQEQPEHQNSYSLVILEGNLPRKELDGKTIFAIDDETHITMLFADEY